ncbi:maltase-glucoamylase-like isoform X2 [Argiope bruennichi]|uniref:maltase-glucoamylase-like isoform X2 n=1 Tax=Argiope bruennichi TaxID=94029 RepID=UPI002494BABB|nr:maltase-glucoamylase-like isoform X2 [Argiope bruennichi]
MFRNLEPPSRKTRLILIGSLAAFAVLLLIVLLAVFVRAKKNAPEVGPVLNTKDRIECPGFKDEADCKAHGCEYANVKSGPACFMKKDKFGYKVIKVNTVLANNSENAFLSSKSATTPYGPSMPLVKFEVIYITENIVRIKISDSNNQRYEVPVQHEFPLLKEKIPINKEKLAYEVEYEKSSSDHANFSFLIRRKADNAIIWDTKIGGLILSDKYLQISSYLPSKNIYGLGEHVHPSLRHDMEYRTWPMFARDRFPEGGYTNLYGVHPFYTCLENSSNSHGVLFLNSNAMDVVLLPEPGITFRTTGGIIDMFFFVGTQPETVVNLYTSLIGKPMLPPYWSLGFQLSRYGYNSLNNVKSVVEETRKAGIPQDVQFLDIDHMENNRDFTWNKNEFAGLQEYMHKTREEYGLKWIIILDPAIEAAQNYSAFESGIKSNVFIKRSHLWKPEMFPEQVRNYNITFGKVWPNSYVAFPNFFDETAKSWWIMNIVEYHKELPFEGLWIDMNEPSNFGTNEDRPFYCPKTGDCWSLKCPNSPYDDPPYNPLKESGSERLSKMTLCMESVHDNGTLNYRHYDVHSLYGWSQTQPTLAAAELATGYRSLVITRSTYPSSGRYAGHWLGDNRSSWDDLRRSIIGMMEFNIFGIPYIGADVCGFNGETTPELCIRWMQLGAFYPFFRNHNGMNEKAQDPVALGADVVAASKRAVERRYILNPYLYTLFFHAHVDGSTVVRPLFHQFPEDQNTWNNGEQFMWGKCLLISPVLTPGAKSVKMYLPDTEWWHFKGTESHLEKVRKDYLDEHEIMEDIPLHVRGGCIIPTEDYKMGNKYQTKNITLYVFPYKDESSGDLYVDSLNSRKPIENENYEKFNFVYSNCTILILPKAKPQKEITFGWTLTKIHVFKVKAAQKVFVGNISSKGNETSYAFNTTSNVLSINVDRKFREIEIISWEDGNKLCQMLF